LPRGQKYKVSAKRKAAILAEVAAHPDESIARIAKQHKVPSHVVYNWIYYAKSQHKIIPTQETNRNGNANAEHDNDAARSLERHTIFAFGHCQTWLEVYANSLSIPPSVLAYRVGELLQQQTRGAKLWARNQVLVR
jgi:transposase-like protein